MEQKRVLAVASTGGHWRQMAALSSAFDGHHVRYVSTGDQLGDYSIRDCSRSHWWLAALACTQLIWILTKERPDVVVSTGALPGLLAIVMARLFGARTVWIDSIANTEKLSLSGRLCRPFAGLWMTQWPEVAKRSGAVYAGSVM